MLGDEIDASLGCRLIFRRLGGLPEVVPPRQSARCPGAWPGGKSSSSGEGVTLQGLGQAQEMASALSLQAWPSRISRVLCSWLS